jgi:hypothetical protein
MIYVIALVLSLVVCAQTFASEVYYGNILHIKNGRKPTAGAALFPAIPSYQLLALGLARLLDNAFPTLAIWMLMALFVVFSAFWLFSFKRLKTELKGLENRAV